MKNERLSWTEESFTLRHASSLPGNLHVNSVACERAIAIQDYLVNARAKAHVDVVFYV